MQAGQAMASPDQLFSLARGDQMIRDQQESGKASPPPAPDSKNKPAAGAPALQSPVRDIIGKVTGGANKAPGTGTPAAPNTTP